MKTEHKKKIQEAKELAKKARSQQIIPINDKWKITRADAYNWAIIRKGYEDEPWYYGRLIDALQALPHKMLDEGQKTDMASIKAQLEAIAQDITVLRFTKFESLDDNARGE